MDKPDGESRSYLSRDQIQGENRNYLTEDEILWVIEWLDQDKWEILQRSLRRFSDLSLQVRIEEMLSQMQAHEDSFAVRSWS